MGSNKIGIELLARICAQKGIKYIVSSPGSRNAPLTLAFAGQNDIEMINITDERSAGFFALGIAQYSREPVALLCTSGTAALNYAPAVAEAYYQRIPLLVLSADRPIELIDQGEGQSIRQKNLFQNFIRASYSFPQEAEKELALDHARRIASEAIDRCKFPTPGPVHINVPVSEPLYGKSEHETLSQEPSKSMMVNKELTRNSKDELQEIWNASNRILFLLGTHFPSSNLNRSISRITEDPRVFLLTETNANIHGNEHCHNIDLALCKLERKDPKPFQPDLLITLGENVISKKIKSWIRKNSPSYHWHVDPEMKHYDTFQCLTHHIPIDPHEFLDHFGNSDTADVDGYSNRWEELTKDALVETEEYLKQAPYSDLKVLELVQRSIPAQYSVHYANSTSVRYAQLFPHRNDLRYFANRGTSGIDGCTSTAAGYAFASKTPTLLITGDVAFFYDSNALWNKHLDENLKIIMINNEGGNIFRTIEGPESTGQLEVHFEAHHNTSAEGLAKTYNVPYYFCQSLDEIERTLPDFFGTQNGRPALMEIKTPSEVSAETLRGLLKFLEEE